jgi:outer membrane putative beta-barrel porin/alpha-amylase
MTRGAMLTVLGVALSGGGCASFQSAMAPPEPLPAKAAEKKPDEEKKPPKTLLEWNLCKKDDDKEGKDKNGAKDKMAKDKEGGNGADDGKNGKTKDAGKGDNGNGDNSKAADSGDDSGSSGDQPPVGDEEKKRIDPDRPHLPESSTTVGLGRAVLEAGYTYNTSGGFFPLHSFPEALLRIGVCADWLEFRIAQNITSQTVDDLGGGRSTISGATDLQIGVKLALTEQQQCLPESALILQMTVPSGSKDLSADRVLPGVHYDCTWEIVKDFLSVETVVIADGTVDDRGHTFTSLGHGVTAVCDLTKKLEAFGELDSFYAAGDSAPPQHYFVAGLVYFITENCEIDVRAGVGLNQHADGYLIGTGFALRY